LVKYALTNLALLVSKKSPVVKAGNKNNTGTSTFTKSKTSSNKLKLAMLLLILTIFLYGNGEDEGRRRNNRMIMIINSLCMSKYVFIKLPTTTAIWRRLEFVENCTLHCSMH
jgi:hypothetical protein